MNSLNRLHNDLKSIESYNARKTTNDQLGFDWALVCAWYSSVKRNPEKFKYSKDEVIATANKVVSEIVRRVANGELDYTFHESDMSKNAKELFDLVGKKLNESEKKFIHIDSISFLNPDDFPPIVWIPEFISVSGSQVTAQNRAPNDTDVIIKSEADELGFYVNLDSGLNLKLLKVLHNTFKDLPVHYSASMSGPSMDYFPIYDLVLVPRKTLEKVEVDSEEFKRLFYDSVDSGVKPFQYFKMLKPMAGKYKAEVYTVDGLFDVIDKQWKDWKNTGIFVEKKFDGLNSQVHIDGKGKIIVMTEQGNDITATIPTIVEALKSVKTSCILCAELELWKDGKHAPRQAAAALTHKTSYDADEKSMVLNVYDVLFYMGKDLHNLPFSDRINYILKLQRDLKSASINFSDRVQVSNEQDLNKWIEHFRALEGSEGAYMKLADFKYELDGATLNNVKFKNTFTIDAKIIKVEQIGTSNAFNYLCTLADGTPVGNTFNTAIKAKVGDVIRVEFTNLNKYTDPSTKKVFYNFYAPRVISLKEGGPADNVLTAEKLVETSEGTISEATWPKRYTFNDVDAFTEAPPETRTYRGMVHTHIRGKSVHCDFRIEKDKKWLLGWTIFIPKGLSRDPKDFDEAKELFNKEILPTIKDTLDNPMSKFRCIKKSPEPIEWETYQGEVEKGQIGATKNETGFFVIVDKFDISYGANKDHYHEYFCDGDLWSGRIVCVKIENKADMVEKENELFNWFMFKTKDQTPYAISERAFKIGWVPDFGFSALPNELKKKIPEKFHYWSKKDRAIAKGTRDLLYNAIKTKDLILDSINANTHQFILQEQMWKGPMVIRTAPSKREFHLLLKDGGSYKDFIFDEVPPGSCLIKPSNAKRFKLQGEVKAGTEFNKTKDTPSWVVTQDYGTWKWMNKAQTMLNFSGRNSKINGTYSLMQNKDSSIYTLKKVGA